MLKNRRHLVGIASFAIGVSIGTIGQAEGIASEGVELAGFTDLDCVQMSDEATAVVSKMEGYLRTVSGDFTRRVIFVDSAIDMLCFPELIVFTVYAESGGNENAQSILTNILSEM